MHELISRTPARIASAARRFLGDLWRALPEIADISIDRLEKTIEQLVEAERNGLIALASTGLLDIAAHAAALWFFL